MTQGGATPEIKMGRMGRQAGQEGERNELTAASSVALGPRVGWIRSAADLHAQHHIHTYIEVGAMSDVEHDGNHATVSMLRCPKKHGAPTGGHTALGFA